MPKRGLPDFPDEFLRPRAGYVYGKPGEWVIVIALEPFEHAGRTVHAHVDFDAFPWDVADPRTLAGTKHRYTAEQRDDDDIEGSMFLNAHNPVDVRSITFGAATESGVEADIDFKIDFDHEGGGFRNRSARIACTLLCTAPVGIAHRLVE